MASMKNHKMNTIKHTQRHTQTRTSEIKLRQTQTDTHPHIKTQRNGRYIAAFPPIVYHRNRSWQPTFYPKLKEQQLGTLIFGHFQVVRRERMHYFRSSFEKIAARDVTRGAYAVVSLSNPSFEHNLEKMFSYDIMRAFMASTGQIRFLTCSCTYWCNFFSLT